MGTYGLTYQDVAAAAEQLAAAGDEITVRSIRKILGSGSHGTISRHLDLWRERRNPAPPTAPYAVPEEVTSAIREFVTREVAAAKQAQDDTIVWHQRQRADAEAAAEQERQERENAEAKIADLENRVREAEVRVSMMREAQAEADAKLHSADLRAAKLETTAAVANAERDARLGELERALSQIEADQERIRQLEDRNHVCNERIADLQKALTLMGAKPGAAAVEVPETV